MSETVEISDESLVALIQDLRVNGRHEAFAALVERHTQMFFAAAYRMCGNSEESEDVVQEAFLKFWNKPQGFDASKGVKFTTWFYRVVTNLAIDHMRKKKPHLHHGAGDDVIAFMPDGGPLADEVMAQDQEQSALEAAIQDLPERQKAALNLCFYEGLSNKEAAEVLGVGVKALESLLMRAKAGLRERFDRAEDKGEMQHG